MNLTTRAGSERPGQRLLSALFGHRCGVLKLKVPRSRSGQFQSQVVPRYQRRQGLVDQTLREIFLLGVSTRQAGRALAPLVGESVSASTVSEIAKVLDRSVNRWHRRALLDVYQYLLLA